MWTAKTLIRLGGCPWLIWVFAVRTLILLVLSCRSSYNLSKFKTWKYKFPFEKWQQNFWLNRSHSHLVGFVMSWLICLAFSSVPYKTLSMVKVKVNTSLYLEIFCFLGQALGTVMFQICLGKQYTLRSEEQSRIRAYTVCHSVSIIWMHYSTVKPRCSNFRVVTANFCGIQIFRMFTLCKYIILSLIFLGRWAP